VFWVPSEGDKHALIQAPDSPFFTTAHFEGHPSVRRPSICSTAREPTGGSHRQELAELVQDAWCHERLRTERRRGCRPTRPRPTKNSQPDGSRDRGREVAGRPIADSSDAVGPLFDWLGNGAIEVTGADPDGSSTGPPQERTIRSRGVGEHRRISDRPPAVRPIRRLGRPPGHRQRAVFAVPHMANWPHRRVHLRPRRSTERDRARCSGADVVQVMQVVHQIVQEVA
jgi:hypothetical protein